MKEKLILFLKEFLEFKNLDLEKLIDKPKLKEFGDLSLSIFSILKKEKPDDLIKKIKDKKNEFILDVKFEKGFLNFYLNLEKEFSLFSKSIFDKTYFNFSNIKKQKILLEYPGPNTNKALHLGHVRNILTGNSLSKILKFIGHKIIKTNINNDRGIAICKTLIIYDKYFKDETPKTMNLKPDKFVGMLYVEFEKKLKENSKLEEEVKEYLIKYESGDKKVLQTWEKIQNWVKEGYKQTYKNFKIGNFDKEYFESQIYKKGKKIVLENFEKKIFEKDEKGNIVFNSSYGKKVVLRNDGTSIYITQDIYLALEKEEDFKCDKYIFIVANEQQHHFKVLFEILEKLGIDISKNYHLSYGYVKLPSGKMKSREGNVIEADELLEDIYKSSYNNLIEKNYNLENLKEKSEKIGYSALCFFVLKYNILNDFVFNPKESLNFIGETGPYIQYTYARIKMLLKKNNYKRDLNIDFSNYQNKDREIFVLLLEFKNVLIEISKNYNISKLCQFLISLCKLFNEFYQSEKILQMEEGKQKQKLLLCELVSIIIKQGLELLDIEVLEEM